MPRYEVRNHWRREGVYIVVADNPAQAANRWRDGQVVHVEEEEGLAGQEITLLRDDDPVPDDGG
jgi:hypothetical protein